MGYTRKRTLWVRKLTLIRRLGLCAGLCIGGALTLAGQGAAAPTSLDAPKSSADIQAPPSETKPDSKTFLVDTGTRIPLSLINSVSTKSSGPGDRVYLETVFP